ncbi:hypothetical protein JTE90_015670 [Oedothorax gibbosus]|uniref:LisH domain-containing protein n=1 Tax=Oedothorax gibbosus TaxID=931172 RepID=A0AAV6UH01_9ARAC|nr:hypothetical protein JTE90_015670 [Oedothorax gibbosus]
MFRKQRAVKQLSADELKTKLYSHFDKTGSLNRIRTELRGKLVSELLKVAAPLETSQTDEVYLDFDKTLLPLQVTNWLVYDHLLRQGHQYALSIFVTEANLAQPEKLLTACDILSLFGLDSTTPEYKSINLMYSTNSVHGCSYSLLLAVIKSLFDLAHHDENLANKELRNTVPKEVLHKLLDSETLFRRKPTNMEEPYAINDRPGLNEFQMSIEKSRRENSELRQRLLQELDRLHAQERSQQVETEQEKLLLKKERDNLLKERESYKEKELLLIKECENKIERKVRELETDFATEMHSKDKTLEDINIKLLKKEQRLQQMEMEFSSQQSSFIVLKNELEDMQKLHKPTQEKYLTLLNDNTNLQKKFENMSDYTMVKDDLQNKSLQVSNLQKEIEDITKTSQKENEALMEIVRNMETKLNAKNSELSEAQRQLNVTRDTLHMRETAWNREKRRLEQENLASKELYRSFSQKLEDQKGDIQALHQTLHLLYYQIADKDNRKTSEPIVHKKIAYSTGRANNDPEVFRINRNFNQSPPKLKDSSLTYIENAKSIKFKLQQQEDELQDKYSFSNYHIFNSVPQSNPRFLTSHLPFDSARAQSNAFETDPSHRFLSASKDNFRNLIGNEMPTLDLSFPAHIKNSLERTFSDNTAVKSQDYFISNPLTSGILNSSSDIDISIDRLEHTSDILHSRIQNFKDPQTLDSAVYSSSKNDGSQNLTVKVSNQTVLNTLEQVTSGISLLEKEFNVTEKSFSPVETEITKHGFQERKLSLLSTAKNISSSMAQEQPSSSSALVTAASSENLKPDALNQTSQDISAKGSKNMPYNNPKEMVTEAPKYTDSKTFPNYTIPDSVKEAPIVVDLDAAWKRKSSLQQDSSANMHTPEQSITKDNMLLDSSLIKTSSKIPSEEITQNKTDAQSVEDTNQSAFQIETSSEQAESKRQDLQQGITENVGQNYLTAELVQKDSSQPTDEESVKDAASESKKDEDSLSEIHFSCGSEQEQQKEDSDNW